MAEASLVLNCADRAPAPRGRVRHGAEQVRPQSSPSSVARSHFQTLSRAARSVLTSFLRLPAHLLLGAIWLYQKTLSPALPVFLGPNCGCRFAPTCSHYATIAVREHGAVIGTLLAVRRLLKCNPLHPGGFDPVPSRRSRSAPQCSRVNS